ncbi:MAG: type II secretion system protein GspN [Thermodesulfovibrionales bacterium]|nr:type II secretion system protein GspN [Thermodesulfovibrionales bacterium]
MIKTVKILLSTILTIFIILTLLWNIAIPEETLFSLISNNAKTSYNYLGFEGFKKGFFFDITSKKVMLFYTSLQQPIITTENLKVNLSLLSLLLFSPTIYFSTESNNASISGYFQISGDKPFEMKVENLNIENQTGLYQFKVEGKGIVHLNINGKLDSGEYRVSVEQMNIKPIQISGVLVPFDKFDSIKGVGNFKNKVLYVKSLTFSGTGIQALAKGSISRDKSDISIEIITTKELSGYSLIDIALNKYKKSEGFYVVPFNTGLVF